MRLKRDSNGSINRDERGASLKMTDSDAACCCPKCTLCDPSLDFDTFTVEVTSDINLYPTCGIAGGIVLAQLSTATIPSGTTFCIERLAATPCAWQVDDTSGVVAGAFYTGAGCTGTPDPIDKVRVFALRGGGGYQIEIRAINASGSRSVNLFEANVPRPVFPVPDSRCLEEATINNVYTAYDVDGVGFNRFGKDGTLSVVAGCAI